MDRRRFLHGAAIGSLSALSGCISKERCGPFQRLSISIINLRDTHHTVELDIETRWLRRSVFSESYELDASEGITEFEVATHLGYYHVTVTVTDEIHTYRWFVNCTMLNVYLEEDGKVQITDFNPEG